MHGDDSTGNGGTLKQSRCHSLSALPSVNRRSDAYFDDNLGLAIQ